MDNGQEKNDYQRYLKLGGIINEEDYSKALSRLEEAEMKQELPNKSQIRQAEDMARFEGTEKGLYSTENIVDPIVILYGILRNDVRPKGVKYHHDQMSDQQILVEAFRMLGDIDSVNRMIEKYPNISFKYQREGEK